VPTHGGLWSRRAPNINCGVLKLHDQKGQDNFVKESVYLVEAFRCKFCMKKKLFMRIHNVVLNYNVSSRKSGMLSMTFKKKKICVNSVCLVDIMLKHIYF